MSNSRFKLDHSVAETRNLPANIRSVGSYSARPITATTGDNTNGSTGSGASSISEQVQASRSAKTQLIGSRGAENSSPTAQAAVALANNLRNFDYPSLTKATSGKVEINNNNTTHQLQPQINRTMNIGGQQQRKPADYKNHSTSGSSGTGETVVTSLDSTDTHQSSLKAPLLSQSPLLPQMVAQSHKYQPVPMSAPNQNNLTQETGSRVPSGQQQQVKPGHDSRRAPIKKQEAADLEAQVLAHRSGKQFAGLNYMDGKAKSASGKAHDYTIENVSIGDEDSENDDEEDDDEVTDATSESEVDAVIAMVGEKGRQISAPGSGKMRAFQDQATSKRVSPSNHGTQSSNQQKRHQADSKVSNGKHGTSRQQQQVHNNRISFNENYRAPSYNSNSNNGSQHHHNSKTHHSQHTNSSNRKMDWLDHSGGYNSYDSTNRNKEHKIAMIDGSYSSGSSCYRPVMKSSKSQKAYMCLKSIVLLLLTLLLIMVLSGMILAGHYLPKMMNDLLAAPRTFNVTIAG